MNFLPEIGMGATIYVGSDCYPATVIDIMRNGNTIKLQFDAYKRIDNNGMSDIQDYEYSTNPNGDIIEATLRKDGRYRIKATSMHVSLGERRYYYDFSF